jgi:hypothetical protein
MTPQRQYYNNFKWFNTLLHEQAHNSTHYKQIKSNWHTSYIPLSLRHYAHDSKERVEGMSGCPPPCTCFPSPPPSDVAACKILKTEWHLLIKLGTVQLFSVAYWRKEINKYVNTFVRNIIRAFMRIYITCVIKQVELQILDLYKFCATRCHYWSRGIAVAHGHVLCHADLCVLFAIWSVEY